MHFKYKYMELYNILWSIVEFYVAYYIFNIGNAYNWRYTWNQYRFNWLTSSEDIVYNIVYPVSLALSSNPISPAFLSVQGSCKADLLNSRLLICIMWNTRIALAALGKGRGNSHHMCSIQWCVEIRITKEGSNVLEDKSQH